MRPEKVMINSRPRPSVELIEMGEGGLVLTAVIYGRTSEEAIARAKLVKEFLDGRGADEVVRRKLKMLYWYRWCRNMHKQTKRRISIFSLLASVLAAEVEPWAAGEWLAKNFVYEEDA